jgi:hypothetical protein
MVGAQCPGTPLRGHLYRNSDATVEWTNTLHLMPTISSVPGGLIRLVSCIKDWKVQCLPHYDVHERKFSFEKTISSKVAKAVSALLLYQYPHAPRESPCE